MRTSHSGSAYEDGDRAVEGQGPPMVIRGGSDWDDDISVEDTVIIV